MEFGVVEFCVCGILRVEFGVWNFVLVEFGGSTERERVGLKMGWIKRVLDN